MKIIKKDDVFELRRESGRKKVGTIIYSGLRGEHIFMGDCVLDLNDLREIENFIVKLAIKGVK